MLKAIRIRIYPDREQEEFINRQLGCCRFVYNMCLEHRSSSYENGGVNINDVELIHHITELKRDYEWLAEVNSKVLQQSVRDLNRAFSNFFKLHRGYPAYKSRHDGRQSCRFPKDAFMGIEGNRLHLVRKLRNLLFRCSRKDEAYLNRNQDRISSLTLIKEPCGEFHISVIIDDDRVKPVRETHKAVGIDLGLKSFLVTSDGVSVENPHFKKSASKRIKRLQKQLSRKQKGSRNSGKVRIRLAKQYKKINDRKDYFLHDIANMLVGENQVICMEDLNTRGLLRNHSLAESISDVSWGRFGTMLESKACVAGRRVVRVGRFYASSKTCHECGFRKSDLGLSERTWICPSCGAVIDRDLNAARNILDEGLRLIGEGKIGRSSPEFTPADRPTADDKGSLRSPLKSSGGVKQEKNGFH